MNFIVEYLITFVGEILRFIINFVTSPFLLIIKQFIPNFNSYFATLNTFITNYFIKGFQFIKMSFINLCGIDHNIWSLFAISMGIILAFYGSILLLKLAYNLWSIFHGSQKSN